ncbi:MAG: membrane dipeptidase, partial [Ignavibacteriae bacterium]|nr:membrane dipeptidase [Ignavibacteriota bacterium]
PMGMENGSPIEGDLRNLKYFYAKGIRYVTLAHSKSNHISDSSYDPDRKWNGLSPFGFEVVAEMNRLGIMVDVSHLTDSAAYDVLQCTQAPVIASHSSCRHFTPGWERNISDELIRALAKNGGIVSINFGSEFLDSTSQRRDRLISAAIAKYRDEHASESSDSAVAAFEKSFRESHPFVYADVKDVVAHIDYVVGLVGVDHVGIGSDFDGLGDSLPTGLKDVSQYPNLIYELLKSGYSETDIKKICGENLLHVWAQVESVARRLQHN